jgi:hypothetical protein
MMSYTLQSFYSILQSTRTQEAIFIYICKDRALDIKPQISGKVKLLCAPEGNVHFPSSQISPSNIIYAILLFSSTVKSHLRLI